MHSLAFNLIEQSVVQAGPHCSPVGSRVAHREIVHAPRCHVAWPPWGGVLVPGNTTKTALYVVAVAGAVVVGCYESRPQPRVLLQHHTNTSMTIVLITLPVLTIAAD